MAEDANQTEAVARRIAERVSAFGSEHATSNAREQARRAIVDTIGVTLAGAKEDAVTTLMSVPGMAGSPGPCLIFGTDRRTSALDAAMINGTASHALDYDDFSGVLGGHQSVPLVPALFAIAEERGLSGEKVVLAYIVGVETEIRLARAVHFHHYDKGWHPTATLGTIGAAAALSHLIGLGVDRTATALAIAVSFASGIKANFGTMTKPLHIGQCGRNAVLATLLAERDFTANHAAFEHEQGFFNVFNGPGHYRPEAIFEAWAEPLEVEHSSIAVKQFPCCGSTHPAIAMALDLRTEDGVRAQDIRNIRILPHGRRLRHTDTPHPQSPLQAKFSVQYVVARALLDGMVRLKDFEGDAFRQPEILRLLDMTQAEAHPDMADTSEKQWGAEIIVTLADGRQVSRRVDDLVGRGGDNPMTSREMWAKFNDCARRSLPREQIAPLFERLETFEKVGDLKQLTRMMEVRPNDSPSRTQQPVRFAARGEQDAPETTWVP